MTKIFYLLAFGGLKITERLNGWEMIVDCCAVNEDTFFLQEF